MLKIARTVSPGNTNWAMDEERICAMIGNHLDGACLSLQAWIGSIARFEAERVFADITGGVTYTPAVATCPESGHLQVSAPGRSENSIYGECVKRIGRWFLCSKAPLGHSVRFNTFRY